MAYAPSSHVELLAGEKDPWKRFERWRAFAVLGGEAISGMTKAEAAAFADQAVAPPRP
jgi:hypothetical protein